MGAPTGMLRNVNIALQIQSSFGIFPSPRFVLDPPIIYHLQKDSTFNSVRYLGHHCSSGCVVPDALATVSMKLSQVEPIVDGIMLFSFIGLIS